MLYWPRTSWVQHEQPERLSTGQRSMMPKTLPQLIVLPFFSGPSWVVVANNPAEVHTVGAPLVC